MSPEHYRHLASTGLDKQLDELQREYFEKGGRSAMRSETSLPSAVRLTPAERALAKIGSARSQLEEADRMDLSALRKDGLDMAFVHIREDAARTPHVAVRVGV